MQSSERWLPVVGYEGSYEVSDEGRVRGLDRIVIRSDGGRIPVRGRLLSPALNPRTGYLEVHLKRDGSGSTKRIHVLVIEAFIGPRPDGCVTRHLDGNRVNNRVANLAWGTWQQNAYDSVQHGTNHEARKTHCKRGHEFNEVNTIVSWVNGRPNRRCRVCSAAAARARYLKINPDAPKAEYRPRLGRRKSDRWLTTN